MPKKQTISQVLFQVRRINDRGEWMKKLLKLQGPLDEILDAAPMPVLDWLLASIDLAKLRRNKK